jgi:protein-export membrane protein SecD
MSDPSYWPPATTPTPTPTPTPPSLTRQLLVVGLVVLVAAYALAAFFTRGVWADPPPKEGTRATFTASETDGSAPSPDALSKTKQILQRRVDDLGGSPSDVVADGATFTVTVPAPDHDVRSLAEHGEQLYVRPVIYAIKSQEPPAGVPSNAPTSTDAQRITDEKALRQSTEHGIQMLAIQFQATRCNKPDDLAGHDDPNLPLVTCSQDGTEVYLLDKAIISGEQVDDATSYKDGASGQFLIDLTFNQDAAKRWADFTTHNVGRQAAFTVDTGVVSAPTCQEPVTSGRTQVSGNFTRDSARDLASTLQRGALPLALTTKSSESTTVPGKAPLMAPRIALLVSGIAVVIAVVLGVLYLVRGRVQPIPQQPVVTGH